MRTSPRIGWPILLLLTMLAQPAWAAPPIDADGDYVHAVTLRPFKMTAPMPAAAPLFVMAWSDGPKGDTLLLSDAESLRVDAMGNLDRSLFDHIDAPVWAFGTSVRRGSDLIICDFQRKGLRRIKASGVQEDIEIDDMEVGNACQVFDDGKGGYLVAQVHPMLFWRLNSKFRVIEQGTLVFGSHRKPDQPPRPCGADGRGRPLALLDNHDGHEVALVQLDHKMMPAKTVWGMTPKNLPVGADLVKRVRIQSSQSCSFRGGRAAFTFHTHAMIFEGERLVSALRNGAPLDQTAIIVPGGLGPYGFQIISTVRLLGDGRALAVMERQSGELKLYVKKPVFEPAKALEAARAARKRGDRLTAHLAYTQWLDKHPADGAAAVEQLESMIDAGWWEDAAKVARKRRPGLAAKQTARIALIGAEARARILRRWSSRFVRGAIMTAPHTAEPPLEKYLAEMVGLAKKHPNAPLVHHSAALLARQAGQSTLYLDHLGHLQRLVTSGAARAQDYPELFDLFVSKGDVKSMKRLIDGLGPKVDPAIRALWRASWLRASGRGKEALQALKGAPETPNVSMLRARLQVESGAVDDGIVSWTRLASGDGVGAAVHEGLGVAYMRRGLVELAVESFLKAHTKDPGSAVHLSNLAQAYARLDKRQDALKQIYTALSKSPDDPVLKYQLGALSSPSKPGAAGSGTPVAILPLDTVGGSISRLGLGEMLAGMLTTTVVAHGGASVVERARLDDLLAEQSLQTGGKIDRKTAVKVGRIVGAKRLLVGNAAEFDGSVIIHLRLVDAESGEVLASAHRRSEMSLVGLEGALGALVGEVMP